MDLEHLRERYIQLAMTGEQTTATLMEEFGCSKTTLMRSLRKLRDAGELLAAEEYQLPTKVTEGEEKGVPYVESNGTIRTLAGLLKACDVDLNRHEVTTYKVNKWDVTLKHKGQIVTRTNWQVKATLGLRKTRLAFEAMLDNLIAGIKVPDEYKKPRSNRHRIPGNYGVLLEMGLFDFHLGNLSWDEESGENWNMQIAQEVFQKAIHEILSRAEHHYKIDRILFPIGNDFFHADNRETKTTAGTQMHLDSRWHKMFDIGISMQRWAIDRIRQIAPVDVVVIPGNHDELSSYALGKVLSAAYEHVEDVNIINSAAPRKYYRYGNTLLGFTHGNYEPLDKLPMIMAGEAKKDWGDTEFREFHVGHFHHRVGRRFLSEYSDSDGVLVRILPSLTATDAWHKQKGLCLATRAAEAYLYDRSDGLIGTIHTQRQRKTLEINDAS